MDDRMKKLEEEFKRSRFLTVKANGLRQMVKDTEDSGITDNESSKYTENGQNKENERNVTDVEEFSTHQRYLRNTTKIHIHKTDGRTDK